MIKFVIVFKLLTVFIQEFHIIFRPVIYCYQFDVFFYGLCFFSVL
jgi:hypothetical protein